MRGKVIMPHAPNSPGRITPAYAGKSSHQHGAGRWRRDHPRVCGEKEIAAGRDVAYWGSPPRVRGKAVCNADSLRTGGITPAYAGKRMVFAGRKSRTWDHPRVCGEKRRPTLWWAALRGSPPRVRGKGRVPAAIPARRGITPAYAGKRGDGGGPILVCRDHPRVCGEKAVMQPECPRWEGSPPRVRGKDTRSKSAYNSAGITPACAGKSSALMQRSGTNGDHPRVCGEKRRCCPAGLCCRGSPPRMRGKGIPQAEGFFNARITPAYAGKSRPVARWVLGCRDHPRVCGEKPSGSWRWNSV